MRLLSLKVKVHTTYVYTHNKLCIIPHLLIVCMCDTLSIRYIIYIIYLHIMYVYNLIKNTPGVKKGRPRIKQALLKKM